MFTKPGESSGGGKIDTIIGTGVEVKGTFVSKSTIRVDGRIEGGLQSEGDVFIGKEGKVKGDIRSKNVFVGGRLNGNAFAEAKLEILQGGQIFGDIKAPIVVIAEGGIFEGNCEMTTKDKSKIVDIADRENMSARPRRE